MRTRSASICLAVVVIATVGVACSGPTQGIARGEALFANCAMCHGADGAGNAELLAPNIAGMPQWYVESQLIKFKDGIRGVHFDDEPGMRMRPMALALRTEDDLKGVSEYVAKMKPVDTDRTLAQGSVENGVALYATCIACHQADGSGNQALNAPPLAGASDFYLREQLRKFKKGMRGVDPRDATGALMRPMTAPLVDDKAINDVVAYITTLTPKAGN
jgi:cytochrome c553